MFKTLLLPNYISEQPQFFRDATNFAKYWKNNIIYIVTFKGHSWLFLALATNFRKFSNLAMVLFLDIFRLYSEELLLIKLSLTLENFFAKYQKVCEISRAKLGTKWKN